VQFYTEPFPDSTQLLRGHIILSLNLVESDMPPSPFTETNFLDLQDQVAALEDKLQKNTEETEKLNEKVSELLDVFRDFQGAQRVLEQLAKIAKPLIYFIGIIAAYLTWHQTNIPKV
jgi:hypothetical protein